jgi:TetR/AcrR family transcriptional regulator, transcriptional repressor for nem operon
MRDRILDAAERRMRSVGYNAVSFRELADDVKVKSASIHYHFPQKEDLGVKLVERYAEKFKESIDRIDKSDLRTAIASFLKLYADALTVGETMCLCAVLGAESNGLPDEVKDRVGVFFQINIAWLADLNARHGLNEMTPSPVEIVSGLEGAMIVSTSNADRQILDSLIGKIRAAYSRTPSA